MHETRPAAGKCPICGNPATPSYRPFCSRRCADVDLARWLKGTYAVPGGQEGADEDGEDVHATTTHPGAKGEGRNETD